MRARKARTRSADASSEQPSHAPRPGDRGRRSAATSVARERVDARGNACSERLVIHIRYTAPGGATTERRVEPDLQTTTVQLEQATSVERLYGVTRRSPTRGTIRNAGIAVLCGDLILAVWIDATPPRLPDQLAGHSATRTLRSTESVVASSDARPCSAVRRFVPETARAAATALGSSASTGSTKSVSQLSPWGYVGRDRRGLRLVCDLDAIGIAVVVIGSVSAVPRVLVAGETRLPRNHRCRDFDGDNVANREAVSIGRDLLDRDEGIHRSFGDAAASGHPARPKAQSARIRCIPRTLSIGHASRNAWDYRCQPQRVLQVARTLSQFANVETTHRLRWLREPTIQRRRIDAELLGGPRLAAVALLHHPLDVLLFHFAQRGELDRVAG